MTWIMHHLWIIPAVWCGIGLASFVPLVIMDKRSAPDTQTTWEDYVGTVIIATIFGLISAISVMIVWIVTMPSPSQYSRSQSRY